MKKQLLEFTPAFLFLCILILIASSVFAAFLFFWNSHFFCSALEINSSCKVSLIKGERFNNDICDNNMEGLNFWQFIARNDSDKKKNCLKKSCDAKNQMSCFYHGLNLKKDGQDFNSFFINSCEKGSVVSACYESGLEFMKLGRKDESEYYFLKACDSGHILSCLLAANQSDSEENFEKIADKIEERMVIYQNNTSFDFSDKQGNLSKREILSHTARKILNNDLSLFFSETADVFLRMGNTDESSYYLKKAVEINKYDVYRILANDKKDIIKSNSSTFSIIFDTLKGIQNEIEYFEKQLISSSPMKEEMLLH